MEARRGGGRRQVRVLNEAANSPAVLFLVQKRDALPCCSLFRMYASVCLRGMDQPAFGENVNRQAHPPCLSHTPSTLTPTPSTLNPQPSTLNPNPSPHNPSPQTYTLKLNLRTPGGASEHLEEITRGPHPVIDRMLLKPKPQPLHPTPQKLTPKPCTLHPAPYTLSLKPKHKKLNPETQTQTHRRSN